MTRPPRVSLFAPFAATGRLLAFAAAAAIHSAAPADDGARPLRFAPAPGAEFARSQRQEMTFLQPGVGPDGSDVEGFQRFATRPVYRVVASNEAAATALTMTVEAMKVESRGPTGETYGFDSDDAESFAAAAENPLLATFRPMVGSTLRLAVREDGTVVSVTGMEAVADKFVADVPPGEECDAARSSFLAQLGEPAMISSQEAVLKFAPGRDVAPGDQWTIVNSFSSGFPMVIRSTATLRERANGRAVVDVESVVEPNPDAPPMEQGGATIRYELRGAMKGTVVLLEESGFPETFDFAIEAKGSLVAEVPGRDAPINVPLELTMRNEWSPR